MRFDQDVLDSMAWEDYRALEKRMCAWAAAAEAEVQSGETTRDIVFDLLFWANTEFHRRRLYMNQEEPETERHAREVLRALRGKRRTEENAWEP